MGFLNFRSDFEIEECFERCFGWFLSVEVIEFCHFVAFITNVSGPTLVGPM